jgi:hypothetical protein
MDEGQVQLLVQTDGFEERTFANGAVLAGYVSHRDV